MTVRPAKTQISLGIRPVWSESSLCAQWVAKDPSFFHADSEDSEQTGRMPRLIWVFAGRTTTLLVLSWGGSLVLRLFNIAGFTQIYNKFSSVIEPAHEIMAFFVLRKLILQSRMRSQPVGLDVWFLVGPFVYVHTLCVRTEKALARLRGCAGSPEPSLVAYVISTIISLAGSISDRDYHFLHIYWLTNETLRLQIVTINVILFKQ